MTNGHGMQFISNFLFFILGIITPQPEAFLLLRVAARFTTSLSLFNPQTLDMGSKMSFSRGSSDQNTVSELTSVAPQPRSSNHASSDCKQVASKKDKWMSLCCLLQYTASFKSALMKTAV